jgi:hypothetical protein
MRRGIEFVAAALCIVLLAAPAPAKVDKDEVSRAIDRGVKHLKSLQKDDGTWPHQEIGATALAGLTLLECGVATDDAAVQRAARVVRRKAVDMTHTYSLALSIMFLDRLGERVDGSLIESMAVRLLAGQFSTGGWSYNCPGIGEPEVRRLGKLVELRNEKIGKGESPQFMPSGRREFKELPKEIQQQVQLVNRQNGYGGNGREDAMGGMLGSWGDNSNTQFAILALWVARRYGIPVDRALGRIQTRFRTTQNTDGGWGYRYFDRAMPAQPRIGGRVLPITMPDQASSAAMTCAGLLGLAMVHGAVYEQRKADPKKDKPGGGLKPAADIAKDVHIQKGLLALGSALAVSPLKNQDLKGGDPRGPDFRGPDGKKRPDGFPRGGPPARGFRPPGIPVIERDHSGKAYYFLWSLERVAVAYGLDTIGKKDWYSWGAEILLANQRGDGSWAGEFGPSGADTCFALLFLRRANLAKDLSASLKGQVKDPKQVELKGGVGFKGIGLKPAIDPNEKTTPVDDKRKEKEKPPVAKVPASDLDADAAKLSTDLVEAAPAEQDKMIAKLRDSKGALYSQALAAAIPQLEGKAKTKAREALKDRLTRLKATSLLQYLKDEDLELRCAAAIALGQKDDKACIGALIDLLDDPEPPVARAAYRALKELTNKDFGPSAEATRKEKAAAIKKWREWWAKNKKE